MKKNIFYLTLTILVPIFVSAQKLQKPDVDKITGDTIVKTTIDDIANNDSNRGTDELACSIMHKKNSYGLFAYITNGGTKSLHFSIHKGSDMQIRLTNDSTITLLSTTDHITADLKVRPRRNGCFGLYPLSRDDLAALKNNSIAGIKIETSNGILDYSLKGANSGIIAKQVGLITNK